MEIESMSNYRTNIFGNNLVAIAKTKLRLKLKKPAYRGMCILELSKVLMYEFHYNYIKINMKTIQDYYLQTLILLYMNLKLKISKKILAAIKNFF